jgi:hypothetical protein
MSTLSYCTHWHTVNIAALCSLQHCKPCPTLNFFLNASSLKFKVNIVLQVSQMEMYWDIQIFVFLLRYLYLYGRIQNFVICRDKSFMKFSYTGGHTRSFFGIYFVIQFLGYSEGSRCKWLWIYKIRPDLSGFTYKGRTRFWNLEFIWSRCHLN